MKMKIFTVIGLVFLFLAVYSFVINDESNEPKVRETQNIKELVNDYSVGNNKNQSASITSHQLIVTDSDKSQLSYDLPEADFFVSIAPYVDVTHP